MGQIDNGRATGYDSVEDIVWCRPGHHHKITVQQEQDRHKVSSPEMPDSPGPEVDVAVVTRGRRERQDVEASPESILQKDWSKLYADSPTWGETWKQVHTPNGKWPSGVQLLRKFMFKDRKICVPEAAALELVHEWHGTLGHVGVYRQLTDMAERFHIPELRKLVQEERRGCQQCQVNAKANWPLEQSHWTHTPVPSRPGESIALDIVSMPTTKAWDGRLVDAALVIVDRHSGWVDAYPILKKGFTGKQAALLARQS